MLEKDRILNYAKLKFLSEGFYKTSMDEFAKELQMSKKTIYKFFPSKESLIEAVAYSCINSREIGIEAILNLRDNVVTKYVKIINFTSNEIMHMSEKWFRDLKMHAPEIWEKVDEVRTAKLYGTLSKLIEQGKKERLIEKYPSEIIITGFVSTIRGIINPEFLMANKLSIQEAFRYTIEMLLNGMLTPLGKEKFLKAKAQYEKELLSIENKKAS